MYQDILIRYNIENYVLPMIFGVFISFICFLYLNLQNFDNYIINPFIIISIVVGYYIYKIQEEYQTSYDKLVDVLQLRMTKIRKKMSKIIEKECKKNKKSSQK